MVKKCDLVCRRFLFMVAFISGGPGGGSLAAVKLRGAANAAESIIADILLLSLPSARSLSSFFCCRPPSILRRRYNMDTFLPIPF